MPEPRITVIMAPRERYTGYPYAIDALYEHTPTDRFDLVVVDGNLPPSILAQIESRQKKLGFKFIHKPYTLTGNEGRNIGLKEVTEPYTVFLDNDCAVMDGWLDPLIRASKELDGWLVAPTVLEDDPAKGIIHCAGGDSSFETPEGKRHYHFVPQHTLAKLSDVGDQLERGPVSMIEFHCMLARSDIFDTIGEFDENLTAFFDHDDITHLTLKAGGQVIYEPASLVSYRNPTNEAGVLQPIDIPYYFLRWSAQWAEDSIDHVVKKWNLEADDPWPGHARYWCNQRRRKLYSMAGLRGRLVGATMFKLSKAMGESMEGPFCDRFTRSLIESRRAKASAA